MVNFETVVVNGEAALVVGLDPGDIARFGGVGEPGSLLLLELGEVIAQLLI